EEQADDHQDDGDLDQREARLLRFHGVPFSKISILLLPLQQACQHFNGLFLNSFMIAGRPSEGGPNGPFVHLPTRTVGMPTARRMARPRAFLYPRRDLSPT